MLKIIKLDINVFNHLFDMYNGGLGLHGDFEVNKDSNHRKMAYTEQMKNLDGKENTEAGIHA